MPYKLTKDFIFLGEGVADNALISRLCRERDLPEFDFPFPEHIRDGKKKTIGGKDRFGEMLVHIAPFGRAKMPTRGILIATDCGDDAAQAFANVARQIEDTGLYPRPQEPLAPVAATAGKFPHLPPLAVMLVPGEGQTGGMETLCVATLVKKYPGEAECLETYLACLDDKGAGIRAWGAEPQGKARLQCLIATTNRADPNKSGRFAIEAGLIEVCNPVFDEIATTLRQICDGFEKNAHFAG